MSANLLYSIHDRDAHPLIPSGGWCVESIALSENPQPQNWAAIRSDINWILRLNWAHNGRDGTIPLRGQYDEFAKRCADYLGRTKGVNVVVIANEPNHEQERPGGVPISPEDYADCFNRCYQTITYERPDVEVMVAAVAPWDITSGMDWLAYYKRMLDGIGDCDGLAVHGYSHGADPDLVWSTEKVQGWYWHFPVIYQTIQAIPPRFATRPVHVTETDQGDNAWVDANTGWVQNAYRSVDEHNRTPGTQKIFSLTLYRWRGDKYQIYDKNGVQDDFKAAAAHGYQSPAERPDIPTPTPPTPAPEPARDIDPKLLARGVNFEYAKVPAGTGYWRITKAQWMEDAAHQIGPDHHICGRVLQDNDERAGVRLRVDWPSGNTTVISKRDDPNALFNYDYAMGPSLNEYSIRVDDTNHSDKASGIGMGKGGNPREHSSTWINFEWTISEGVTEPVPPTLPPPVVPVAGHLIWPVTGPITQYFGAHEIEYPGSPGHDGIDFGVVTGTPVVAVADGVVLWVDNDPTGFGLYVRIFHPAHGFHSFMGHLSRQLVAPGQYVKQGETVGLSGSTGNSTGPHLHYSCRIGEADTYFDLHDGYHNGCANPLAVHGLINKRDPNMRGEA